MTLATILPYLSGAIGFGAVVAGLLFTGRKIRGDQFRARGQEIEDLERKLSAARKTIDSLYAYVHRFRRWVFRSYPDVDLPEELMTVPEDESRQ